MSEVRVESTEFISEGELIRGDFVIPNGNGPFPGICKFHGLPGGLDQVSGIATNLAKAGFIVLTFDFRGFRRSEGFFSLSGRILDARISIDHLLDNELTRKDWVGVYGASYGGAIAICTAVRDNRVNAVCIRAPVYDTTYFAKHSMFRHVPQDILKGLSESWHKIDDETVRTKMFNQMEIDAEKFNPWNEIDQISPRPLYITTGDNDESIPLEGVTGLFERAKEPKEFHIVSGADHRLSNEAHKRETAADVVRWFREVSPKTHNY